MINDGGRAFPSGGYGQWAPEPGMSLLDYFAGQALTGIITTFRGATVNAQELARLAYTVSEAMIAAREKLSKS